MTTNKLKNSENFNISEGNVKEDNIFPNDNVKKSHNVANNVAQRNSQDEELMKKIFPHKEIIEGESVLVFPYIEEATPLKDVPQEVVSHMEKTIDHISQEEKKVSLTELWKKGELEDGEYYIKSNKGDVYIDICADGNFMFTNYRSIEEVLAPVPSFEEYNKLQNSLEHEKVRATHYYKTLTEIEDENEKLEELLKEWMHFYPIILYEHEDTLKTKDIVELYDKTREVLK